METTVAITAAAIQEKLSSFILSNYLFGDAAKMPKDAESLMETGIVDSTGILELIDFVESEFGFSVSEEETIPQNLDSLGALTRYVEGKLRKS